ncbi:MAG: nucleotidyltransferase domain-containing protein [Nitrospinae bacterium]|nr:nucleotidyltransferase domain-containing protein [Nitrospinota bacterium]
MSKNKRPTTKIIDKMVARIVKRFHPERIILFGSYARGDAGPDSDVDLLVVMPVEGSKREQAVKIRVELHDLRISKDIIVSTPEEFAWRKEVVGTIEYPAVHEGKELYVKA